MNNMLIRLFLLSCFLLLIKTNIVFANNASNDFFIEYMDTSFTDWSYYIPRNNCPSNQIGGQNFEYIITTKTFQDTAILNLPESIPFTDLQAEAQSYANANGSCINRCARNGETRDGTVCCSGFYANENNVCVKPYWVKEEPPSTCCGYNYVNVNVYCGAGKNVLSDALCDPSSRPSSMVFCTNPCPKSNGQECSANDECTSNTCSNKTFSWDNKKCGGDFDACPAGYYRDALSRYSDGCCQRTLMGYCVSTYTYTHCTKDTKICTVANYGANCSTDCSNTGSTIDAYGNCTGGSSTCSSGSSSGGYDPNCTNSGCNGNPTGGTCCPGYKWKLAPGNTNWWCCMPN